MAGPAYKFDLKLLTPSREVGLRRLRTYAAAIGGNAAIFHSYNELIKNLSSSERSAACEIVLYDSTCLLNAEELRQLHCLARVFTIQNPNLHQAAATELTSSGSSAGIFYCTLESFLASPVARMSLVAISRRDQVFCSEHVLQWGFASQKWPTNREITLAAATYNFTKALALTGKARHLAEMFAHFLQVHMQALGLVQREVVFAADGLTVSITARCNLSPSFDIKKLIKLLQEHAFPIAMINIQASFETIELVGLVTAEQNAEKPEERLILVFNNSQFNASEQLLDPLNRAG